MHEVRRSIRRIAPSELPTVPGDGATRPMTDAELLNVGIAPLGDDLYSCVDQYRRDPETFAWTAEGPESPGVVIAEGSLADRHARLPAEVAVQVLRAQVIRSDDPATPADATVETNLAEAAAALALNVGDVNGAPLVDLSGPAAVLEEAQRLVEIPGNGIERHLVSMAEVAAGDVLEADRIIPHAWAGESAR